MKNNQQRHLICQSKDSSWKLTPIHGLPQNLVINIPPEIQDLVDQLMMFEEESKIEEAMPGADNEEAEAEEIPKSKHSPKRTKVGSGRASHHMLSLQ